MGIYLNLNQNDTKLLTIMATNYLLIVGFILICTLQSSNSFFIGLRNEEDSRAADQNSLQQEKKPEGAHYLSLVSKLHRVDEETASQGLEETTDTLNHPNPITTHVLDTSLGLPGANITITLFKMNRYVDYKDWMIMHVTTTDTDGRASGLLQPEDCEHGDIFELRYEVGEYFARRGEKSFWPYQDIDFQIHDCTEHTHVGLVLNPWGFTGYRGS